MEAVWWLHLLALIDHYKPHLLVPIWSLLVLFCTHILILLYSAWVLCSTPKPRIKCGFFEGHNISTCHNFNWGAATSQTDGSVDHMPRSWENSRQLQKKLETILEVFETAIHHTVIWGDLGDLVTRHLRWQCVAPLVRKLFSSLSMILAFQSARWIKYEPMQSYWLCCVFWLCTLCLLFPKSSITTGL